MPRILFVSGFHPSTRARSLAYEFERFGPLIRCDVPAPRNPHAQSNPYAFVEFRSQRDAEDAYYDMHGKDFDGSRLSIQWAKNPPSSVWRYERGPPRSSRDRDRSRSPRRRSDRDDRDKDRAEDRDRDKDRDRGERRRRSRSPVERRRSRTPERRRSASPERRRDDRARTPPPTEEPPKTQDDRAQTPPFEN
ncbi:RNA-binding domain-containing protein [Mycena rebaudengoi]|nr:RNA-binding domain-containing protein [Mycena rebaudengoi]